MYAVVNTGGKQYKVREGDTFRFEKLPGETGTPVIFDRVLMFSDGENVLVGQPEVPDIAVRGRIVEQGKSRKIIVFKYKRRKRYRRKMGHRQRYTAVKIDRIGNPAEMGEETPAVETMAADQTAPEPEQMEADTQAALETESPSTVEPEATESSPTLSKENETKGSENE